ncbi:hypothetical protein [Brucella pituitosa]
MAKKSIKDDRPYDSAKDHTDKGDYVISVSEAYSAATMIDGIKNGGHWSAHIVYKTKTLRFVMTGASDNILKLRPLKRYPDDPAKDARQKQKAHDRMIPFLEKFRSYRQTTKKRYEVVREESWRGRLPIVPDVHEREELK